MKMRIDIGQFKWSSDCAMNRNTGSDGNSANTGTSEISKHNIRAYETFRLGC